ncbi:hypothetical protein Cni_G28581 [Canna indica]|uniref:Uncharacterized protein n=1 Tax=Canna indica TaxID=4628 RepID=A0AAQ3L3Q8_9LILI|nr:hypothetical protein Cni_G28581 [Canna indica]
MAVCTPSRLLHLHRLLGCSSSLDSSSVSVAVAVALRKKKMKMSGLVPINCTPLEQSSETQQEQLMGDEEGGVGIQMEFCLIRQSRERNWKRELGILCEPCNGRGWLLCDFCEGKKNNVRAENNRIYRRCPTCKAVGYLLCSKCKVFKCITFPDYSDGQL